MTECNGCGECCDPVVLPFTQREMATFVPRSEKDAEDRDFVLHTLRQLPGRDGLSRANQFGGHMPRTGTINLDEKKVSQREWPVFYECPHFNTETRRCMNYDNRPPVCRGFPHYEKEPNPAKAPMLPLDCSFRVDFIQKREAT